MRVNPMQWVLLYSCATSVQRLCSRLGVHCRGHIVAPQSIGFSQAVEQYHCWPWGWCFRMPRLQAADWTSVLPKEAYLILLTFTSSCQCDCTGGTVSPATCNIPSCDIKIFLILCSVWTQWVSAILPYLPLFSQMKKCNQYSAKVSSTYQTAKH